MPREPYKTVDEMLDKRYSQYGGAHRFHQLIEEDISVEERLKKVSTEFPVSYRTAGRWYYRFNEEKQNV